MNNLDSIFSMMSPLEAECFGHLHTPEVSHVSSDNDKDCGSDDGDFDPFKDIYHGMSIGALLTLLPNLEVSSLFQRLQSYLIADLLSCEQIIRLAGYTEQLEQESHGNLLDQIVRRIARSHLNLDIVTSKPLSRLREINLEDRRLEYEGDGDESENLGTFASFGLLPAMRNFLELTFPAAVLFQPSPGPLPATSKPWATSIYSKAQLDRNLFNSSLEESQH